jgi:hypothetical protein
MKNVEVIKIEFFYRRENTSGGDMYRVFYKNAKGYEVQSHHIAHDELGAYKKFMKWVKGARYA